MNLPRVLLCFGLAACAPPERPNSTAVDSAFTVAGHTLPAQAVNAYIGRHLGFTSRGGAVQCAYTPLGQDSTRIYIQTLCVELVQSADSLVSGSGRGGPVALRIAAEGDSVRILSHEVPVDGGGQAESIRRIFPDHVANTILNGDPPADTLEKHLGAAAHASANVRSAQRAGAATTLDGLIEARVPRAVAGDTAWPYQQRVSADLNGDGKSETVVLLCDVSLGQRGTPLWEDGHGWQLYIEDSGGERTWVYARFLPNGMLRATLTNPEGGARPALLLLEHMPDRLAMYEIGYRGPGSASMLSQLQRDVDAGTPFTLVAPR